MADTPRLALSDTQVHEDLDEAIRTALLVEGNMEKAREYLFIRDGYQDVPTP